jgi:hypothetical protein
LRSEATAIAVGGDDLGRGASGEPALAGKESRDRVKASEASAVAAERCGGCIAPMPECASAGLACTPIAEELADCW